MPASRLRRNPAGGDLEARLDPVAGLVGADHRDLREAALGADPLGVLAHRGDRARERIVVLAGDLGAVADRQLEGGQSAPSVPVACRAMTGSAKGGLAAVGAAAVLAFAGCGGDDDESMEPAPVAIGYWISQADRYCSDGTQEAAALRVPSSARQYVVDSQARAEILAVVRDGIVTLGQPEEVDGDALATYLEELNADIKVMTTAAAAASRGPALLAARRLRRRGAASSASRGARPSRLRSRIREPAAS